MRLVVDASVAVKWFVSEPLLENARLLLSHRDVEGIPVVSARDALRRIGDT